MFCFQTITVYGAVVFFFQLAYTTVFLVRIEPKTNGSPSVTFP